MMDSELLLAVLWVLEVCFIELFLVEVAVDGGNGR